MQLKVLLGHADALPSAPQAVLQLAETFDDENSRTSDVVEAIESDPVLVLQLMRVANSPLFFRGRMIETPEEAVRLLGLSKVRSLVIGLLAKDCFPTLPEEVLNQYWRVSLYTAELARHIAEAGRGNADNAYLGGLIHMIGQLVMRVGMPDAVAALDAQVKPLDPERIKAEVKTFAYSYAEVGGALATKWKLPQAMVRILERQRAVNMGSPQDYDALTVQAASWRVRAFETGMSDEDAMKAFPPNWLKSLGVDVKDIFEWKPGGAEAQDTQPI